MGLHESPVDPIQRKMRRPCRAELEDVRRSQYDVLLLLERCIRRRPMPETLWRTFVVLTCDDESVVALVA